MGLWRGPDGIEVEAIVLDSRPMLRVTRIIGDRNVLIAYCATVHEVGTHVDLGQLIEAGPDELSAARRGVGVPPI